MVETQISVPETIARLYSESEAEVVREVNSFQCAQNVTP